MKNFILILFFFTTTLFAQISSNLFMQKKSLIFAEVGKNSYKFNMHDHLRDSITDSFYIGIDGNFKYRNSAVSYYENYNDNIAYSIAPYIHYKANKEFSLDLRINVENIQDDYVYPLRTYWSDVFANHRGDYEIAKVAYQTESFKIKLGRDYYMPGMYFYENLLFSKYNYPYDQLGFEYKNKYFTLSSYYLSPNTITDSLRQERHINVHRLSINLGNGYLAFNDVMLYGGYRQSPDLIAFNPLIFLYPYRKNKKHLDGNNLMSLEFYYNLNDYFIFTEILLDDWQADHKVPDDLEPTEWGLNTTFGINNVYKNLDWKINYTRVANRTFNAPTYSYEKYIYKNYPIGHFLGNNFWEAKTSFTYHPDEKWLADLTFYHLEYGDEAVYGAFNTDYLDYTVKQGYEEDFPFGTIKTQTGFELDTYYDINENFLCNFKFSYWLHNSRLKNDINISLGLAYRFKTSF